jgi:hypothetical protein
MLQKAQPTLKEVQKQFEDWRRCRKNRRTHIPSALWEAATSLSGQYSVHEISKRLRLNHTALRDRIAGEAIKPQVPAFVELDMISSRAAAGECIIEMEKADARMKIILKGNYPDIAEISKAFLG